MGATNCLYFDDSLGNEPVFEFDISNKRDILAHYLTGTEVFALMSNGYIRSTSGWQYRVVTIGLGDIAASSDAFTAPLFRAKHNITISSVSIGVDTDIGEDLVNYQTWYLEQSGSTTDISTMTANVAWSKRVPQSFSTLDSTAKEITAGQTLTLRAVKTASGKAYSGLTVTVVYLIDQPWNTVGTATDNIFRVQSDIGTGGVVGADMDDRTFLMLKDKGVEKFRIDTAGKMHGDSPDQYYYHVVSLGDLTASDSRISCLMRPHCNIEVINIYIGIDTTLASDSNSNYWRLKFTDATNIMADVFFGGPLGTGNSFTKGVMQSVGTINPDYAAIASGGSLRIEYSETGTGPTTSGIAVVVCFKKTA